jgi:hypothetical protein
VKLSSDRETVSKLVLETSSLRTELAAKVNALREREQAALDQQRNVSAREAELEQERDRIALQKSLLEAEKQVGSRRVLWKLFQAV